MGIRITPRPKDCPRCGRTIGSGAALASHLKSCNPDAAAPPRPSDEIRAYILAHPDLQPFVIADRLQRARSTVWKIRTDLVKAGLVPQLESARTGATVAKAKAKARKAEERTTAKPVHLHRWERQCNLIAEKIATELDAERQRLLRLAWLKLRRTKEAL